MKHPALARVFSVVLAILGLLLLAAGVGGFRKNGTENRERQDYEKKIEGRIDSYLQLSEQMENTADYQEVMAALDSFFAAHEKAASQHKTDTAIYSATKGGMKMGEEMIVALRAEMEELRQQLQDAESRKAVLEGILAQLIAANKERLPCFDEWAAAAGKNATDAYTAQAKYAVVAGEMSDLIENEPDPADYEGGMYTPPPASPLPELPTMPEQPIPPELPSFEPLPGEDPEAAYTRYQEEYQQASELAAAYQQACAVYTEQLQAYYSALEQYEQQRLQQEYQQQLGEESWELCSAEYQQAHDAWEAECTRVKRESELLSAGAELRRLTGTVSALVRQLNTIAASFMTETGGLYPGLEELLAQAEELAARLEGMSQETLVSMSNEDFLALVQETRDMFGRLGDAFYTIAMTLSNPAALIAETMEELQLTETLVAYVDSMLARAEHEIQAQLENIWYQLGELEKDALKLEAEKLGLDREAALLSKDTLEADELRELNRRYTSARQLLLNLPTVREAVSAGAEPADSAREYLNDYAAETRRLFEGKRLICGLAVAAGVLAVLSIPASYELIRKRFFLLTPPLLCLACAAAADGIHLSLGLGQMYAALFTAVFALIQLLIVLPRRRRPAHAPRH